MTSPRPTFSRHLRNLFLGGLVVVVPIVITVNALLWLFRFVDGLAGPLAEALLGRAVPGIGGPGSENAFKRFVLARLPGRTTPGFLTGSFTFRRKDGAEH